MISRNEGMKKLLEVLHKKLLDLCHVIFATKGVQCKADTSYAITNTELIG